MRAIAKDKPQPENIEQDTKEFNVQSPITQKNNRDLSDFTPKESSGKSRGYTKYKSTVCLIRKKSSKLNKDFLKRIINNLEPEIPKDSDKVRQMIGSEVKSQIIITRSKTLKL